MLLKNNRVTVYNYKNCSRVLSFNVAVRTRLLTDTMEKNGSELLLTVDEEKIMKSLNLDIDKLNHYMGLFSQWIASQPHLPQISNDSCRKKFLVWAKLDFEKAKKKFLKYCYNSLTHKEFVCDRVITLEGDLKAFSFGYIFPFPKLTPEGYRVSLCKIFNFDDMDSLVLARFLTLGIDYRLYRDGIVAGEIGIFDFEPFKANHYARFIDINYIKFVRFSMMQFPFNIKHLLVLNCPSAFEKAITLAKSIIPKKIAERISLVNLENLQKYIPKECLPEDFGGKEKSLKYLSQAWMELVVKEKDFLWAIGQAKPTGPIPAEIESFENEFGVDGSFRKLNID